MDTSGGGKGSQQTGFGLGLGLTASGLGPGSGSSGKRGRRGGKKGKKGSGYFIWRKEEDVRCCVDGEGELLFERAPKRRRKRAKKDSKGSNGGSGTGADGNNGTDGENGDNDGNGNQSDDPSSAKSKWCCLWFPVWLGLDWKAGWYFWNRKRRIFFLSSGGGLHCPTVGRVSRLRCNACVSSPWQITGRR